ncbi:MAG: hypothetical protein K2L99_07765, partial [Muribaculaceae bacterium]|nr:hypothetical protein [Muribaculaceae bacterium]
MTFPVDIAELYAAGRPFAFYRFPGEDAIRVAGKDGLFFVNCWNTPSKDNVHVAAARAGAPEVHPWP